MATGLTSWKIAKALYIVPLLFAYTPFIGGSYVEVFTIFAFALVGLYAFSGFMQGHLEKPMSWPMRIALLACGAILLLPVATYIKLVGLAGFVAVLVLNIRSKSVEQPVASSS